MYDLKYGGAVDTVGDMTMSSVLGLCDDLL